MIKVHEYGNFSEFENFVKHNKELLNTSVNFKFDDNTSLKLRPIEAILMSEYNENSLIVVEIMLKNGANINTYYQNDTKNITTFFAMVASNRLPNEAKIKFAELFVKYGADLNLAQGVKNANLLDEAVFIRSLGLYEFFLKNKIETKDRLWYSTRWLNQSYNLHEYITLSKKQDKFSNEIINSQRFKEKKESFVKLLEIFLKYNDLSDQQDTLQQLLKEAVFANNIDAIKLFLQTPYQKEIKKMALEYAKSFGRDEIVNLVVD